MGGGLFGVRDMAGEKLTSPFLLPHGLLIKIQELL